MTRERSNSQVLSAPDRKTSHRFVQGIADFQLGKSFAFKVPIHREDFYCLFLNHSLTIDLNYGLLLLRQSLGAFSRLFQFLEESRQHCNNALLMPLLLLEKEIEWNNIEHRDIDYKMTRLEEETGQHENTYRPRGDPLAIDFTAATRKCSHAYKLSTINMGHAASLKIALKNVIAWRKEIAEELEGDELSERLDCAADQLEILQLDAEYEEKRIIVLMQVVRYLTQSSLLLY
jgi:hypothetical protein